MSSSWPVPYRNIRNESEHSLPLLNLCTKKSRWSCAEPPLIDYLAEMTSNTAETNRKTENTKAVQKCLLRMNFFKTDLVIAICETRSQDVCNFAIQISVPSWLSCNKADKTCEAFCFVLMTYQPSELDVCTTKSFASHPNVLESLRPCIMRVSMAERSWHTWQLCGVSFITDSSSKLRQDWIPLLGLLKSTLKISSAQTVQKIHDQIVCCHHKTWMYAGIKAVLRQHQQLHPLEQQSQLRPQISQTQILRMPRSRAGLICWSSTAKRRTLSMSKQSSGPSCCQETVILPKYLKTFSWLLSIKEKLAQSSFRYNSRLQAVIRVTTF